MQLKMGTVVVLVFDTDAGNIDTLKENIKFLNKQKTIKKVLCITQVKNLEDELKRSCNIKEIKELTGSKSNSDFKHDMRKEKQFGNKMMKKGFDMEKFWIKTDNHIYKEILNQAAEIKLHK